MAARHRPQRQREAQLRCLLASTIIFNRLYSPLTYAATYSAPSAHISFVAHDDRPILLLEDIDYLFDSVFCTPSSGGNHMILIFGNEDVYSETMAMWGKIPTFTVVTAHPTCNSYDQRGAWL